MSASTYPGTTVDTDRTQAQNNEHDSTGRDTRRLFELVCYAGITTLVCLIGIPTNIINCLVFRRQGLKDRVNLCLFALALADCLYLSCSFAVFSVNSLIRFFDDILGEEWYLKTGVSLVGVLNVLRSTSSFIDVIVAVDRCICVVWPLRASTLITTRTMTILILTSFVLFQGYQVLPFTFNVVAINANGVVRWNGLRSRFYYDNKVFIAAFVNTFLGAAITIGGFLIVLCTTTVTVIKLRLAMRWRSKTNCVTRGTNDRQVALTVMITIVSCVYVITVTPFVFREISFWIMDCEIDVPCNDLFMVITALAFTCSQINSAIHFFIYYSRSLRFRIVLQGIYTSAKGQTSVRSVSLNVSSV